MVLQCVNQGKNHIILDVELKVIENMEVFAHIVLLILLRDNPKAAGIRKKSKEFKIVNYISSKYDELVHDRQFYVDLENGYCSSKRRIGDKIN